MSIVAKTSALLDAALALIYPQACRVCGSSVEKRALGVACTTCWEETPIFECDTLICWKCGAPAPGSVPEDKRQEVFCRRCDREPFTTARACGAYDGALRASVLALKSEPHVAARLVSLLYETQQRPPLRRATCIVPVPLHSERLSERGFNQAAVLGGALAKLTKLPFDEWSLVRTADTARHRAGMDAKGRRESVEGAFEVTRPRLIENERVLLIDDVFTSGATASVCAQLLKNHGAQEVYVLTIARTV